ncbi:MAG: VENN motif pre-toxin domain-containing protein [Riemerella sp.]|nr:VENN motif pre-toxin domain-containing protein [Flavobacteriaceae bacterium]MBF1097825.1 VENN motif pre-toxin domain-containing protein [Riemerella sp.]
MKNHLILGSTLPKLAGGLLSSLAGDSTTTVNTGKSLLSGER